MTESPPWWTHLLQAVVWLFFMSLVMGWIARSRLAPVPRSSEGLLLQLPRSLLVVGIVAVALFAACAVLSFGAATGGPVVAALFLGFALLGGYIVLEYVVDRYVLTPEGLAYRTLLGQPRTVQWHEIQAVRYARTWGWLNLRLRGGRTVRLSVMLVGLPELAQALLYNVDHELIAADAADVLTSSAEGHPPSIWG